MLRENVQNIIVITANAAGGKPKSERNPEVLGNALGCKKPDFLCLQELVVCKGGGIPDEDTLDELRIIGGLQSIWIGCSMETHRQMRMERDIYYRAYSPDEAKMNWDLHAHDWQNFEHICKPKDCIELLTNRSYILIDEYENLKDNAMDYPFTLFTDLGNEIV